MENIRVCTYDSPVGILTLAGDEEGVSGLWLSGQKHFAEGYNLGSAGRGMTKPLEAAVKWLDAYFAGGKPDISSVPLKMAGGVFRLRVWKRLAEIPYGETVTYGEIAKELSSSARAVGGAVGHNPVSIIVPCHRVVGVSGKLTGYAGGLESKVILLCHEGVLK